MEFENNSPNLSFAIQDYVAILKRRRTIMIQAFVLISVVGIVVTLIQKPVYEATAELLVDGPSSATSTVDTADPLSALFNIEQEQTVATQVEVLQAQPLLDQVTRTVGKSDITVSTLNDTNVIQVVADANNPGVAAGSANTLLDLYIAQDADTNLQEVQHALDFVQRQAAIANLQLDDAEDRLKDYKSAHHITTLDAMMTNESNHIALLTTNYQTTEQQLASAKGQVGTAQSLASAELPAEEVSLPQTNDNLDTIKAKILDLQSQRASLTSPGNYTATAPPVRSIDAQIATEEKELASQPAMISKVASTPNPVRDSVRTALLTSKENESALEAQLAQIKAQLATENANLTHVPTWEVQLTHLQKDRDDAAAASEMLTTQLGSLTLREQARHIAAHIIERAQAPSQPIRPKKLLNILFAVVAGLICGASLALLQEYLDDRINSYEDAERLLALPSLGRVPQLSAEDARLLPQMKGLDPETESYRILRTNIHFASVDKPLKTLQVTSSGPGEGKTTTAANLAFAMAMDGKKVILVDTDLRRPSLHRLLGVTQVPGLTDLLLGTATLEEVMHPYESLPEMSVIASGITPPNPSELLNSQKFKSFVEQMTSIVDIVIFDSPPILAASDAQIIASKVDGVVLVVANGETRKASARHGLKLMKQAHANVIGVAYNKTDINESYEYYHYHYSTPPLPSDAAADGSVALLEESETSDELAKK